MSRPTKLILFVLLPLLLGIPAVYAMLMWRPANPLTFRMERVEEAAADDPAALRTVHIKIGNAGSTPIHLVSASLGNGTGEIAGDHSGPIYPAPWFAPGGYTLTIPARGSVDVTAPIDPVTLETPPVDGIFVHYTWTSKLKWKVTVLSLHLRARLPASLEGLVPRFPAEEDVTPLQAPGK
ncbi:hypothetical protein DES53_115129 [Roseimicrobium gellanilyticum]|uniref:Uncharacterized protein n=1 Tax=Roseimicrobium gellanilyticum TaxID=748857 RepID=A0A366H4Z6_9BACT|nr:hypothetical protein [Roseimicrobium gellanilyticum]RBP36988.1 hypothetical protein DES53_115129 [Roseimicrobium gellanilyticum]